MKLNGSVEKIFFSEVENHDCYSDFSFDNHLQLIAMNTLYDDDKVSNYLMYCCESYLNTKEAIKQFKNDAKNKCFLKSEMCAYLVFDTNLKDDELMIEVSLSAYDEKRGAFDEIAACVSYETMQDFVDGLSVVQQDLLFEIV